MDINPAAAGPAVSVILCAYTLERWDDLNRAVAEVCKQSPQPDEIVLVIDHNPELLERARSAFPGVKVIANQETRGLSGARNSGVRAASCEILAFLDEDAWPQAGWLSTLLAAYRDPQVLGAGGAIDPHWVAGRPGWFPLEFDWVVGCTYRGMPERPSPVRNLIGANMSFRRSVFTVGGFNQALGRIGTFPVGGEETEFSIRLRQQLPEGLLLYLPSARVHHKVPPERGRWAYFASRCFVEGQSKALVTRLVGAQDGLGSERAFTLRTLPLGVLRSLGQALGGDLSGLGRALAIPAGLLMTAAGYLVGKWKLRKAEAAVPLPAPLIDRAAAAAPAHTMPGSGGVTKKGAGGE